MLHRQSYMAQVIPFVDKDIIKVFTGIRRAGKSTLMEQVKTLLRDRGVPDSQMVSINFEDIRQSMRQPHEIQEELLGRVQTGKLYLFFDEVQELPAWEKLINSLRVSMQADIYITGSNSSLLSGELASLLGGRYVEIRVYPFSLAEIVALRGADTFPKQMEVFDDYLRLGGFPFIHRHELSESSSRSYLTDLYNSIVLQDIVRRHSIRDVELFAKMMLYFLENIGNTFSAVSLSRYLKSEKRSISNETIYNYIAYAEDSLLLHRVPREDVKGKELLRAQEKLYLTDHGFRELWFGSNRRDINLVLENMVYMDLLRRGWDVRIGKLGDREIDFVAIKGGERRY